MKNLTHITGILTGILSFTGHIFKTFHLAGAGLIISMSIILFVFGFIPLLTVNTFKSGINFNDKIRKTIGNVLAALAVTGVLFKIMWWPYANLLIISSVIGLSLVFIPLQIAKIFKSENDLKDKIRPTLGLLFISLLTTGILFKIMHWPHALKLAYIEMAFVFLIYVPFYFFSKVRKNNLFESITNTVYTMVLGGLIYNLINLSTI